MSLLTNVIALQRKLDELPIAIYDVGEAAITAGTTTGRLLILKQGLVSVVKDGFEVAKIRSHGAMFGELAALLDKPHTADVIALQQSSFYVAPATMFMRDPFVLLFTASIMALRLDRANRMFVELRRQIAKDVSKGTIVETVGQIEEMLSSGDVASLH